MSSHDHSRSAQAPSSVPLADAIDRFVLKLGQFFCWAAAILIVVIIAQVTLRYGFGKGLVILEELQWHLYAIGVMFGLSYAQVTDSHIRVDVLAMHLSTKALRFWEVFGILVFTFPFIFVVFYHSLDFVGDAWRVNERSDAPLGLPWRWAIKGVIPMSFGLLGLAVFSRLLRDVVSLIKGGR